MKIGKNNTSSNVENWCCLGEQCSRRVYQNRVFSRLQEVRLRDEDGYLALVYKEVEQKSEHVWAKDKSYFNSQPFLETAMYIFLMIYFIGFYYIYIIYKPIDMHKLPQINKLSVIH